MNAYAAQLVVHTAAGSSQGSVSSISTSVPATFSSTAGNCIVVWARQGATSTTTGTVTDVAGNTYTLVGYVSLGSGDRAGVWIAKNITGNASNVATVTWSASAGFTAITALEISGSDTTTPLDAFVTGTAGSSNHITSPSFTTGVASTVVIMAASIQSLSNVYTPDTGYTLVTTDPDTLNGVMYKIVTSIQTGITPVVTSTQTAPWEAITLSIKAPATTSQGISQPSIIY